jgi:hypothetical protein
MNTILMPHNLAQASYNLPLNAMRLKLLAMADLDEFNYIAGYALPIKITASKWQQHFPDSENPYRDLKRGVDELVEASVIFKDTTEPVKFFSRVQYIHGSGLVELEFYPEFLWRCLPSQDRWLFQSAKNIE